MAAPQIQQAPIARVYAESLYALAAESDREDEVKEELETLGAALDADPKRTEFFGSPLVDDETKHDVVERVLRNKASDLLVDTLQVMRRKGRLGLTRAVIRAYRELWMKRRNQVEARVASAVPLTDAQRAALRAELGRVLAYRSGREPVLVERVDPALLGGLVISVGDIKLDSTVANDLARLGAGLMARAADELLSDKTYVTNSE